LEVQPRTASTAFGRRGGGGGGGGGGGLLTVPLDLLTEKDELSARAVAGVANMAASRVTSRKPWMAERRVVFMGGRWRVCFAFNPSLPRIRPTLRGPRLFRMESPESPLDRLRHALRELRRGEIDAATARRIATGPLAALFGSQALPRSEERILAALRRECELIERAPFQPGDLIGGLYQVQRILRGGFGLIYLARQLGPERYARSGNLVALKTPLPRHLANPELRELFITEAAHCVALGPHPNLVLAYGVEEHNRLPFLVLEYIPGARTLQDALEAGAADWRTALRVGLGTARGLAFARLVHGDLKPVNLLLGGGDAAKVADFGLSLSAGESADESILAGTPGFFAPEMLAGRPARTVATDVYAFGVTLFVAATGRMPFPIGAEDRNLTEPAPDPRRLAPDIPGEFAALVLGCLERDPARRPASFATLAGELARLHRMLLGAEPPADPAPDAPARAHALVNAAQTQLNLGRLEAARRAARDALAADPRNWKAHNALGLVHLEQREFSAALASFCAAHEFNPDALEPLANAARTCHDLGRREDALRWLHLALARCTGRDAFAALDGCSHLAIELLPERDAYDLIHRILAENPHAAITWNNRAILMRRMGAYPEALESADRALALNPTYARAYVQKANALVHLHRRDDALLAADRALALDERLAGAHAAKFSALASLGRMAEARACIERGLSLLPGHDLLLRARRKLG